MKYGGTYTHKYCNTYNFVGTNTNILVDQMVKVALYSHNNLSLSYLYFYYQ